MADIRPNALPDAILPLRTGDELIVDQGSDGVRKVAPFALTESTAPVATQAEAQTGSDNSKRMTPLRTKQSIASEIGVTLASNSQGSKADSAVQSVNGKTGNAVSLDKNDVGLGNVDNTSDANKPISTATQAALNLKANDSIVVKSVNGVFPVSGNVVVSAEEKRLQDTRESAILEFFESNIKFIETAGGGTVGDGLGGLYTDVNNGNPDSFVTLDGRTWYKVADVQADRVVQSPAYTRMTSRLLSDVLAGQPISPFHFGGNGLATDQSDALQNALEFTLLDDTNPQSCTLDLVGRNWRTNKGLSIKEAPKTKRRITNGQITVIGGFSDSSVLEIATPTTTGGVDWVSALSIDNINFLGGSNKSSVLSQDVIVLENSHKIRITDCYFQWFNGRGIFDKTTRAAVDLIVKGCTIEGTYNTSEGIRTSGSDIELTKNIISNCNRGIVSLEHSVNVEFNHIYDCVDRSIFYNAQAALCVGNYIDGPGILIRGNRGVFSNNKFLRPNADNFPVTDAFITIQPIAPNTAIQGMVITNNNFANPAGGTVNMINVDTTNGNIGEVYRTTIEGNTGTDGVNYQRSHPKGRTQISAGTSGTVDLSSQVPFGHIKHATVSWKKDPVSSVIPAAAVTDISASDVVTVGLSQAATGLAYVSGDINESI